MKQRHTVVGLIGLAAWLAVTGAQAATAAPSDVAAASPAPARRGRASIGLEVGRATWWVGESIPVVLRARFRDVDGVTLEGVPELKSEGIFTRDLAREPHQSTETVDGEPVLVATWSGTITPSTSGPLALSVELPVRLRFHEASTPVFRDPTDGDPFAGLPFAGMDIDPADPSSMQRMLRSFQQSFARTLEPSMARAHDEALTLRASARPLEIKALPVTGQPAAFSGAVGRFDMRASVTADRVHASEPVTLLIKVQGQGDLDRVELSGVASSADWKAYPTTAKTEAPVAVKAFGRKTFEQILVPLHGGSLTIPPVPLTVFDPIAGRYTAIETSPLTVTVEGALDAAPAAAAMPSPGMAPSVVTPATIAATVPPPESLVVSPRTVGWRLAPALAVLLGVIALRLRPTRNEERSLRRALRRTAKLGKGTAFFETARRIIVVHFANRWGVAEGEITADTLRKRLGPTANPLLAAMSTADALRFGRADLQPSELGAACTTIEANLRDAT
jgi:hypothetical protein